MSYGFIVKASDDVPVELSDKFNISTTQVIYRGIESRQDVSKHFVQVLWK